MEELGMNVTQVRYMKFSKNYYNYTLKITHVKGSIVLWLYECFPYSIWAIRYFLGGKAFLLTYFVTSKFWKLLYIIFFQRIALRSALDLWRYLIWSITHVLILKMLENKSEAHFHRVRVTVHKFWMRNSAESEFGPWLLHSWLA